MRATSRPAGVTTSSTRQGWDAFHGTGLDALLRERGVTQVVLAGLATGFGVESTARSAHDLGYHVVLVTDAMTDPGAERHEAAVRGLFPALGETTTTAQLLAAASAHPSPSRPAPSPERRAR